MSGSAELQAFPWLYPYQEDGPRLDRIVHRPIVPVALEGSEVSQGQYALVDSGCSHVLAAPHVATAAGLDPRDAHRELSLGIGGTTVKARFLDVRMRLFAPDGDDDDFVEWETEVGFLAHWKPTFTILLGQVGFLDAFTVTMSQHTRLTAVENVETFDARFGVQLAP